jgi:ribosomal protein S20
MRKEILDMSITEWNTYSNALNSLRKNGVLARFVDYHTNYQAQGHGGCYFLPWHRQFLFEFERELNKITPGLSIPYWDWTKTSPGTGERINEYFTDDPIWNRMGGAQGYRAIPKPPFQNWAVGGRTCLRDFFQNDGNLGGFGDSYIFLSSQEVNLLSRSRDSFRTFSIFLEANHGTPHVAVGGSMADVPTSPDDPIFYSHHAFIDKIWSDWQKSGNGNSFGGRHSNPDRACNLDGEKMNPPEFGRTVRQILEKISQCTAYIESSNAGPTARFGKGNMDLAFRQSYGSSSSALAFDSAAEKKQRHVGIAYKKRYYPALYKSQVRTALKAVDSMIRATRVTRLPQAEIDEATKAFQNLLLKLEVDVVKDEGIVGKSIPAIQAQGAYDLAHPQNGTS